MWNVAMYDEQMLFTHNDIHRVSIGSTTDGLTADADGSLTIYLQSDQPTDEHAPNW
jgi:hypothetical protein